GRGRARGRPLPDAPGPRLLDPARPPRPAAPLTVPAGRALELRCKGGKMGWTLPAALHAARDPRLSIQQHERYSQLVLANASAADTGQYGCWPQLCPGPGCGKDEAKTISTYVFVPEEGELFVPSPNYFDVVYLVADQPAVVPCRVTVPAARVTLHREFPAQEIVANGNGSEVVYDAQRGFVFPRPQAEHQGVVYCRADAQGLVQVSNKYQLLFVAVPKGPPPTTILATDSRKRGRGRVSVHCSALGQPGIEVEFSWTYPGQKDRRPVTIQDSWRLVPRGDGHTTRVSTSVLTLNDFASPDAGLYTCAAQTPQGRTTVAVQVGV
ncbi:platelet-derived growth factor receptor-like protein, partial [Ornithorhynchus anatinus]